MGARRCSASLAPSQSVPINARGPEKVSLASRRSSKVSMQPKLACRTDSKAAQPDVATCDKGALVSTNQNGSGISGQSVVKRTLFKLNKRRNSLKSKINESFNGLPGDLDELEHGESGRQNSVSTLDLFRYAELKEKVATGIGVLFMFYAASWQPISVFILAIMASLMGQYKRQSGWLEHLLTNNTTGGNGTGSSLSEGPHALWSLASLSGSESFAPVVVTPPTGPLSSYDSYSFLSPIYPLINPVLSFFGLDGAISGTNHHQHNLHHQHNNRSGSNSSDSVLQPPDTNEESTQSAIHDILDHESNLFLHKSLEINGSAFVLALTQLLAFFLGLSLITWAARRQAARLKILYFKTSLYQEVTWFETLDSASGSGSSLNALVERFEDGIGMKFALLCYFIGHVCLFALTAFYQMFQLAAFCMPFVLLVGLAIAYLSDLQAVAIGEQAMFAKRSLQLAEEILAAIRTVFAFNGQQKEMTRYSLSLEPVYRRSLIKHLYTALNTSLSRFSIFACFSAYCFYAMRLFPPYSPGGPPCDRATVLAVMRGAEVSIVNILISIPFMEALQQSKGSIARIYAAIERLSRIDPSAKTGAKPASDKWLPSISFRQVQFGYAERAGPHSARRRSTQAQLSSNSDETTDEQSPGANRKRSVIYDLTDELKLERNAHHRRRASSSAGSSSATAPSRSEPSDDSDEARRARRRSSAAMKRMLASEAKREARSGLHKRILDNFNLEIKAGQSVALVGPSGSGKSTVLSLVQRLYDITGGQLLLGQYDVKDLNVAWLRNQIGFVGQEPRLFDMSIAENIRLGLSEDQLASYERRESDPAVSSQIMQQVVEAAKLAGAHSFINRLPSGYATRVGSAGVQLSGGQKQRIAIARALIRKPKLLLLDESTSALDTESESHVQAALKVASQGRTTLTVAHRLSTICHVDLIVVMNAGRVVECGTHEELMKGSGSSGTGLYRRMYEEQALASSTDDAKLVGESAGDQSALKKQSPLSVLAEFEEPDPAEPDSLSATMTISDDSYMEDLESELCSASSRRQSLDITQSRQQQDNSPSMLELLRFIEMPKWSSLAGVLVCLMAGLILPMNLIAHSYLFSAFAYSELDQIGEYLHLFGLVVLSFSTFVLIVSFLQIILPGYVGEKLSARLRAKTMDALLAKPMFYFDMDSNSAGALCDRLNSYISNIQTIAGSRVATVLEAIATLSAGAFFGFGQNLRLSLFCLSFALLVLFTTIVESRILEREGEIQRKIDAQLAHLMADALSNIKTIATLNKEHFFIAKFRQIIERRKKVKYSQCLAILRTFLTSLKFVMPAMSWSASMYYGCHLLVAGQIDLQTVFIVCPVVLFAVNDTFRALVFVPELMRARKSMKRLHQLNEEFSPKLLSMLSLAEQLELQHQLHLEQQKQQHQQYQPLKRTSGPRLVSDAPGQMQSALRSSEAPASSVKPDPRRISFARELNGQQSARRQLSEADQQRLDKLARLPTYLSPALSCQPGAGMMSRMDSLVPGKRARGQITFEQVEFAYPNRPNAQVLDRLSLSVEPGQSVALVGGSGSGKSTCTALLEKFYHYHAGQVTFDGLDLRLLEPNWLRSQIGLVGQEPALLSYTIGDNIRYGDNSRHVSLQEVIEAAKTANIHEFIMSLPDQYDTELSSSAYSSSQLSGGQRQRIAIARALVRKAPILIFDEATSALDSRNESIVQDALNKARRGRTSLTIAHRLSSIRDSDKIFVLAEGRVVESGTHEQLMRQPDGHYRRLWASQTSKGKRPEEAGEHATR